MERAPALIVDLDGTLADIRVRLMHLQGKKKDWRSFNKSIETDDLHEWCREIILRFHPDYKILLVSGRTDDLRSQTLDWLKRYRIPFDRLFMRRARDMRPDQVIKEEIFTQNIKDQYEILFVLDDRRKVVDMWRSLGLTVLQCAPGEF
jgi:hypothetical protein